MRTYLQNYRMIHAASLKEALELMQQSPAPIPFAGGTDLMVYLNFEKLPEGTYLNLHSIPELKSDIQILDKEIRISPLTTYRDVRLHPFFKEKMILLSKAASVVGAPGIQSLGTWVGNIVNASPAADGVPALMIYDAKLELSSAKGKRTVLLADFYQGYKKMDRKQDELITSIILPVAQEGVEYYRKVGERKAQAITKVLLAGRMEIEKNVVRSARIVFGSVMPYTYRSRNIENMLTGKKLDNSLSASIINQVAKEIKPIDDIRSTARYRLKVAQNLMEEFLSMSMRR